MNLEASLSRMQLLAVASGPDLAHLPPFHLGSLLVEPALRRLVGAGGETRTIQPLAMRVLLALTDAQGETCSRDDLVSACWSQRIVGDDAVHRVISNLRRDLARVGAGAVAIETIPKVGYRLRVAETAGTATESPEAIAPVPPKVARPWFAGLLVVAGLVSAGVLASTHAGNDVTEIAVIADPGSARAGGEAARFTDGLTGDLARLASAMPSLAFVEPDGGQAAQEPLLLRVALEPGTQGRTARVRMVDRKSGAVVWSREFTAESGTIAELREIVANGITGVVQCGLDRSATFDDPVGLRLYLGACEGLQANDFARARAFAQQITEFRPDAPAGWACLANTTIFAASASGTVGEPVLKQAEAYARRALAADAKSGLAYLALAMAASWRGEPNLAILEAGLRADPDFALLHKHYALALTAAGMVSQAVDPALRAVALQPHDSDIYRLAVAALVNAGRTEEAVVLSERSRRLWRFDRDVAMQRLGLLYFAPDPRAGQAALAASPVAKGAGAELVGQSLAWRIDPDAYDWSGFDQAASRAYAADPGLAWTISLTAARMGETERALAWLERAPVKIYPAWSALFAPEAAAVRRDPRFFARMASVGMVRRWEKSGRWPDFCADPKLGYDCRASARALAEASAKGAENGGRTRART